MKIRIIITISLIICLLSILYLKEVASYYNLPFFQYESILENTINRQIENFH